MSDYITYDDIGCIHYKFSNVSLEQAEANTPSGQFLLEIVSDLAFTQETHFVLSKNVGLRPEKLLWPSEVAVPWSIPISELAQGSTVVVSREFGSDIEITDLTEECIIEDAGVYTLFVQQPFPHHNITHNVTITGVSS